MKWTHALAVGLLALGLAACTKPKQVQPETPPPATTDTGGAQTTGIGTAAGPTTGAMSAEQQQALAALQARNVVYFAYDSSEIRDDDLPTVTAHAAYLVKYKNARVRLEGHTDERGSREYNIGLGERRAQTVRRALMLQGVADSQITTVSYGEERPAAEGSDEAAYARNRRVELVQGP
ncbi:MAG TPA: peptidoglycan-associated lipoprotein Pal [Steroidobacteraceae bacterium]